MRTKILQHPALSRAVHQLFSAHFNAALPILFGGDRLLCCDEGSAVLDDAGKIVALATIAPNGEEESGTPTIVGVYVVPESRGQGLGLAVFRNTLVRCQEQGFERVRVDVISTGMAKIIDSLTDTEHAVLEIHEAGRMLDMF